MTAYQPSVFTKTLLAAVDLSGKQYRYVAESAGKYNVSGGVNGVLGAGFLMNAPLANEACSIADIGGQALGVCAATISASRIELKADSNGELLPALPGDIVVAISLESAAVDDVFAITPVYYIKTSVAPVTLLAAVDLSSSQGLYVGDNGSGACNVVGGATGAIGYGFLANAPILGAAAIIQGMGSKSASAVSGAAISGAQIELFSDAAGKLNPSTTAGDIIVAISTASAAGADEALTVIPVLYRKHA